MAITLCKYDRPIRRHPHTRAEAFISKDKCDMASCHFSHLCPLVAKARIRPVYDLVSGVPWLRPTCIPIHTPKAQTISEKWPLWVFHMSPPIGHEIGQMAISLCKYEQPTRKHPHTRADVSISNDKHDMATFRFSHLDLNQVKRREIWISQILGVGQYYPLGVHLEIGASRLGSPYIK